MNVEALLSWYAEHRRRLPWREQVSPYRTLVSEIMCQQTRVETVVPYFERFMEAFPSFEALAAAPLERVLERWSGLGYYSRARNLHAAARFVVARGGFPTDEAGLRELPGVGRYTAGAIGSIALGLDLPVVDGNVERVLCRHDRIEEPPKRVTARLWSRATSLVPPGRAGDFNQAIMELGARVCTPRAPRCAACPVRGSCLGADAPERYPATIPKKATPRARFAAVIARREGMIFLVRRPEHGLLGGLWEPPMGEGLDPAAALAARTGLRLHDPRACGEVRHVFSHLHQTTTVFEGEVSGDVHLDGYAEWAWAPVESIDGMALSTLARKLLAAVSASAPAGSAPRGTPRTRRSRRDSDLPS